MSDKTVKIPEVELKAKDAMEAQRRLRALQKLNSNLTAEQLEKVANASADPIKKVIALRHL